MSLSFYFDPAQLMGVIFGYKMQDEKRREIIDIFEAKKKSVKLYEAIPVGNEIQVQIAEVRVFH